MKGIDVSENNGTVDWAAVAAAGIEFAIIRLGYGHGHLDSKFYENVNAAIAAGLKIGVYYYSYALSEADADYEAQFVIDILNDCGLTADKLPMGVWFDMEGDEYKTNHGLTDSQEITNICSVFINKLWKSGFNNTGLYANLNWMLNVIYVDQLGQCPLWLAEYNDVCDLSCDIWQYTSRGEIGGALFDFNVTM